MDFDIGNILYIVITIVAVAVGLLGKKKKPAEGGSGTPGSEARPSFMENLERVLTMGQEPQEVQYLQESEEGLPAEELVKVEVVEEDFSDLRNRPSIMDEYERIMNSGNVGELDLNGSEGESMTEILEVSDLDELPGTDYFEIVKDFDAGTAIVYSSIINRLDY
jgi:RNA-binding protein YhbY